ncbi:MAG: hypothetical protein LBP76_09545 [Treponema sp.]|nr:hypothetical protein [Treponema sp.]
MKEVKKKGSIRLRGITIIMFSGKRPWQKKFREEITFRFYHIHTDWIIKAVTTNLQTLGSGPPRFIVKVDGKPKAELGHLELKPFLEKEEDDNGINA